MEAFTRGLGDFFPYLFFIREPEARCCLWTVCLFLCGDVGVCRGVSTQSGRMATEPRMGMESTVGGVSRRPCLLGPPGILGWC